MTIYTEPTESMQTDPEARHARDAASVASSARFPLTQARCADTTSAALDWVPARERALVPAPMSELCRTCPGRQECLLWAMAGGEHGYWGGTTSKDREQLRRLERSDVDTADWLQQLASSEEPRHRAGQGSYRAYRKGCHCDECRTANADARSRERARRRTRAVAGHSAVQGR